jgi:hypothetical protein
MAGGQHEHKKQQNRAAHNPSQPPHSVSCIDTTSQARHQSSSKTLGCQTLLNTWPLTFSNCMLKPMGNICGCAACSCGQLAESQRTPQHPHPRPRRPPPPPARPLGFATSPVRRTLAERRRQNATRKTSTAFMGVCVTSKYFQHQWGEHCSRPP